MFTPQARSNAPSGESALTGSNAFLALAAKRAITMAGLPEPQTPEEMLTGVIEVASKLKQMYDNAMRDRQTMQE